MATTNNRILWKDRKRFLGMPLSFTRYSLSPDRLFLSVGCFSIRDEELLLYRVRDISIRRGLWQRIFGCGSITVHSSDKSTPQLLLKNIKRPMEAKELLHDAVEECKIRRRMRFSEMMTDVDDADEDLDNDGIPDVME